MNDLLLMADAPTHHLFTLLKHGSLEDGEISPDILCVIEVALEGGISQKVMQQWLAKGKLPKGDLIPWNLGHQFQYEGISQMSGARILRIAVHPKLRRAGYGTKAVTQLEEYYSGKFAKNDDIPEYVIDSYACHSQTSE